MKDIEIRSCPFCGSDPEVLRFCKSQIIIRCNHCKVVMDSGTVKEDELYSTLKRWNKRKVCE